MGHHPASKTFEVYQPGQVDPVKTLGVADELDGGEVIPGFELPVKELFA